MPDGSTLPPDGQSGGQVNLYYQLEDFENAFSLLSEQEWRISCLTVQVPDLKTAFRPRRNLSGTSRRSWHSTRGTSCDVRDLGPTPPTALSSRRFQRHQQVCGGRVRRKSFSPWEIFVLTASPALGRGFQPTRRPPVAITAPPD